MENREAIKIIKGLIASVERVYKSNPLTEKEPHPVTDALILAISALEKQSRIITVTDAKGGLLASISDKDIIEENGVHVIISEE